MHEVLNSLAIAIMALSSALYNYGNVEIFIADTAAAAIAIFALLQRRHS